MKIYDCFMFFDEEMLLDLRLNIMNKYVDKFVITESLYMHSGKSKKLIFLVGYMKDTWNLFSTCSIVSINANVKSTTNLIQIIHF